MNPISESKKLLIQLRADEDEYVTGQLDLNATLDETDRLYDCQVRGRAGDANNPVNITANEIMPDSDLMKIQTRLAKRSAKFYKPDSLVFNATEFATKLKLFYAQSSTSQDDTQSSRNSTQKGSDLLWLQLGSVARKLLYTVPSFIFIHGTFDVDPVEVVKKKRKMKEKDRLGKATKPESMSLAQNVDNQDMMIKEAERVLGILERLLSKNEGNVVCFYEFVIDPTSFGRTVENVFILSLLVKEGCVRIMKDRNGLPCLSVVRDNERNQRNPAGTKQCIMSIGVQEWKCIVKTFKFKKPLIPPRKSITQR